MKMKNKKMTIDWHNGMPIELTDTPSDRLEVSYDPSGNFPPEGETWYCPSGQSRNNNGGWAGPCYGCAHSDGECVNKCDFFLRWEDIPAK